ncbi:MCP four helix bundle domain-containing protein [Undibacterium sp. CY18W]|uniref:MCP four helix bundle domain-containing protein n=1 Tax=Undibacterium hunanense TaxID=2762292 RepID=A0ABR6ZQL9_9BURK|nr:methyl-accepting chemotaxis protein [Undibacterium hunanense]MBC3917909.1 MCP four helix bundle domain-containing protein [Undibacterium hunanense]
MISQLKHLSVGKRLGLGFALILILFFITTVIAIFKLNAVAAATDNLLKDPLTTERLISDWYRNIHTGVRRTTAIAKSSDPSLASFFAAEQEESTKASGLLQKAIAEHMQSPDEVALFKEIGEQRQAYLNTRNKVVTLKKEDKVDEANTALEKEFLPAAALYIKKIEAMLSLQRKQIDDTSAEIQQTYQSSKVLLIVLSLIAALLSAICAWMMATSITKPLARATAVAEKMAQGDLSDIIDIQHNDEIGKMMTAINGINTGLSGVIGEVRHGTETISVAAAEIATGNADLSSRTESQASSLEETASSMEELTSTVKQNADNARQANQLVISASGVAVKGGEVVGQVVTTMGSIKESSNKIVDIISVIDGIAFQTNILALNAAVEAARAGEQGRGFAVVATEVRNLAQRSASAAKEIKYLIDDSVGKVEHGSKLVDTAGKTMQEIVTSVQHVADIMSEITAASQEQSAGIEQVNLAVTQMDEMTQQNAALVEEAAAAAESMRDQSAKLSDLVSQFNIIAQAKTAATPTPRQPARATAAGRTPAIKRAAAQPARLQASATKKKPASSTSASSDDWEEF